MKIYTRTGDDGQTGLFAGPRVMKSDPRIEAYGTVDELNALLGATRAETISTDLDAVLARIQHELFVLGAELATPQPEQLRMPLISPTHVAWLEETIDRFEARLQPLRQFILPGGTRAAAALHVARTACRRAERLVVSLQVGGVRVSESILKYLNRLSDLLFVLARSANASAGQPDVPWVQPQ